MFASDRFQFNTLVLARCFMSAHGFGARTGRCAIKRCVFVVPLSSARVLALDRRAMARFLRSVWRRQISLIVDSSRSTWLRQGADMKFVTAIIKPFKLDEVREALSAIGVQGMTVTEAQGFGRRKGRAELYRGAEYVVDFLPRIKIEIAIGDDLLDRVIESIERSASTGNIGDGKIFVFDLAQTIRIRTGEAGITAL
jgi:nitrogen regulatory protein P-II 2